MTIVNFPKAPTERRAGVVRRPVPVLNAPDPWDEGPSGEEISGLHQQIDELTAENRRLERVIDNIIRVIDGKELR